MLTPKKGHAHTAARSVEAAKGKRQKGSSKREAVKGKRQKESSKREAVKGEEYWELKTSNSSVGRAVGCSPIGRLFKSGLLEI